MPWLKLVVEKQLSEATFKAETLLLLKLGKNGSSMQKTDLLGSRAGKQILWEKVDCLGCLYTVFQFSRYLFIQISEILNSKLINRLNKMIFTI